MCVLEYFIIGLGVLLWGGGAEAFVLEVGDVYVSCW